MNQEIENIVKKRNLHPIAYERNKSVYIIYCKDNNYVIKLNTNNYDIYKYLISRNFLLFPENFTNINDNYDISLYVDETEINKEQRLTDYINIIALLHKKTSYNREIDLDEIKEKYETINNKLINLKKYYLDLNNKIDHELFLSPSSYLLVRNITLIYNMLDNTSLLLNDVYKTIKENKSIRVSLLHNSVDLDHLIISKEDYLINWDKSYFDNPIYEIEKIFRKYYLDIELNNLLKIYESINNTTILEKKILLVNLSIPKRLLLTNNTYLDTLNINNEINYLKKVYKLLIKYKNEL